MMMTLDIIYGLLMNSVSLLGDAAHNFGGPPRTRIWNLEVRSFAPYPIWPAVPNSITISYLM